MLKMITEKLHLPFSELPDGPMLPGLLAAFPKLASGLWFDIETTGFSADHSALYLIGAGWYNGKDGFDMVQWLAESEDISEQEAVLEGLKQTLSSFSSVVTFNGQTFDLPYLKKKGLDLSPYDHCDLFQMLRPLKAFFGLDHLTLKDAERFLGYHREDPYSGGALIPVYKAFVKRHNPDLIKPLLLHNREDITDLLIILPLLTWVLPAEGAFDLAEQEISQQELRICLSVQQPLAGQPAGCRTDLSGFGLEVIREGEMLILHIPVFRGTLKYYYPDYRNYYYLPAEDTAIHKSVAAFVDASARVRADKTTAYTKKTGVFLPRLSHMSFKPVFKEDHTSGQTWIENTLSASETAQYVRELLCSLILHPGKS